MRKYLSVLLLLLSGVSWIYAEDSLYVSKNAVEDKKYSLEFQFSEIKLYSLNNGGLSLNIPISLNSTLRIGADLQTHDYFLGGTMLYAEEEVTLHCQYFYRPSVRDDVLLYYGAGPSFGFGHAGDEGNEFIGWKLGVDGTLGVEWFITHSISFSGEYYGSIAYRWNKENLSDASFNDGQNPSKNNSISVSNAQVRLGLSIYFGF
jgi:hypothetical protein